VRRTTLSAAGSQVCQRIQREWANVEVSRNELLIQMMLYMILCSENVRLGDEEEAELLELCFGLSLKGGALFSKLQMQH